MEARLKEHLKNEHKVTSLHEFMEEIVYGGIDGIVTTFAVVAGFAGAGGQIDGATTTVAVLLFGLANLFGDGASMGLGNFLALRSSQDIYMSHRRKEEREIEEHPEDEGAETLEILVDKGFSEEDAQSLLKIYRKNKNYWTDFMMNHELEMPNPMGESPAAKGMATFFSFIFFGFIPLIPYVVDFTPASQFNNLSSLLSAIGFTSLALLLLGILRWRATRTNVIRSVTETLLVGCVSGGIAFFVGTIFQM